MAVGQFGDSRILVSQDGLNWTVRDTGCYNWLDDIAYGSDSFVAVGSAGTVIQSGPVKDTKSIKVKIISDYSTELLNKDLNEWILQNPNINITSITPDTFISNGSIIITASIIYEE